MDHGDSSLVPLEGLADILACVVAPADIELVLEVLPCVALEDRVVAEGAFGKVHEFEIMVVVAELQAVTVASLPEEIRLYDVNDETGEDGIRRVSALADVDGIGRVALFLDASGLPEEDIHWFKLFTQLVGELNTTEHSLEELNVLVSRYLYGKELRISLLGGKADLEEDILPEKQNLYYIMMDLLAASLFALCYTNDMFTGYVFIEINTIAACSIVMAKDSGQTILATIRYLMMSLVGSGVFLFGVSMLYTITGHLLMPNLRETVAALRAQGAYLPQLTVVVTLLCAGLAAKSALFPFHTWVPDAYSSGTPTSSALLASLVSKSYIVLLVKVIMRVIGPDVILDTGICDVLFAFGVIGMVAGSVVAIRSGRIRRMIAWSSVAQIGYIFMGIGLGIEAGMTAALFHIIAHAAAKSVLFLSVEPLSDASGGQGRLEHMRGAGYRAPLAGVAFTVGALSLTGLPFLGGFVSKLNLGLAALARGGIRSWVGLAALALSTLLNVLYMVRAVLVIWSHGEPGAASAGSRDTAGCTSGFRLNLALAALTAANILLFFFASPIMSTLRQGIELFG